MDELGRLIEERAIMRLKARYFRCMDTKDWDGFLEVFTDDVELRFDLAVGTNGMDPGEPGLQRGKAEIRAFVPQHSQHARTVHHGHMPEIDILSDTEAKGIWAMEDIVDHGHVVYHGWGHYHETYRKVAGEWRIATVHLKRLRYRQVTSDRITL